MDFWNNYSLEALLNTRLSFPSMLLDLIYDDLALKFAEVFVLHVICDCTLSLSCVQQVGFPWLHFCILHLDWHTYYSFWSYRLWSQYEKKKLRNFPHRVTKYMLSYCFSIMFSLGLQLSQLHFLKNTCSL